MIIWSCLVRGSSYSMVELTTEGLPDVKSIEVEQQVVFILYAVFCPFAGWLADVYFGTPQKLKGCFNPSFNDQISPVTPRNVCTIEVQFDTFSMIGF